MQIFCQHMAVLMLSLYLGLGIDGAMIYRNQDLMKAIQ